MLLSYAKITLYDDLLASDLPDDPFLEDDLIRYFPTPLQEGFAGWIRGHTLKREIIATATVNSLVNRTGPTFMAETADRTGMGASDITRAYIVVRDSFGLRDLWARIEALDTRVDAGMQTRMMLQTRKLVDRATSWMLRNVGEHLEIGGPDRALPATGIEALRRHLDEVLYAEAREVVEARMAEMVEAGVPADLAHEIAPRST